MRAKMRRLRPENGLQLPFAFSKLARQIYSTAMQRREAA
jgi:hypothetical protein